MDLYGCHFDSLIPSPNNVANFCAWLFIDVMFRLIISLIAVSRPLIEIYDIVDCVNFRASSAYKSFLGCISKGFDAPIHPAMTGSSFKTSLEIAANPTPP